MWIYIFYWLDWSGLANPSELEKQYYHMLGYDMYTHTGVHFSGKKKVCPEKFMNWETKLKSIKKQKEKKSLKMVLDQDNKEKTTLMHHPYLVF